MRRRSRGLTIAALSVGALSGAGFGWSAVTQGRFDQNTSDEGFARSLRLQNNVAFYGGAGLGVVAGGLLTGAVVTGEW